MARETLQAWAKRFVADLCSDGTAVPLDRVLRRHLLALSHLRARGLTWESIADAVRQAGGRRKNSMPFTAAQFRADVSRLQRAKQMQSGEPPSRTTIKPTTAGGPLLSTRDDKRIEGRSTRVLATDIAETVAQPAQAGSAEAGFDLDAVRRRLNRVDR